MINAPAAAYDAHENDDSWDSARVINNSYNDQHLAQTPAALDSVQVHFFSNPGDKDRVKFYAYKTNDHYRLQVNFIRADCRNCDAVLEIYDSHFKKIAVFDQGLPQDLNETAYWSPPEDGVYYAVIRQYDPQVYGEKTAYTVELTAPMAFEGTIYGMVTPPVSTVLTTDGMGSALSLSDGTYFMPHIAGSFTLRAQAAGFARYETPFTLAPNETLRIDIPLSLLGDMDGDHKLTLSDAIIILNVMIGVQSANTAADVNTDARIGLEEAIYILQTISGMRYP